MWCPVREPEFPGQELYDALRISYHLQLEMAAETYVLAMFTVGDTKEGFERFTRAILEIDGRLAEKSEVSSLGISVYGTRLREGMPFARAWEASGKERQSGYSSTTLLAG